MPTTQQFAKVNGKRIAIARVLASLRTATQPPLFYGATSSRSLRGVGA